MQNLKSLTDQQLKVASIVDLTDDVQLMRKALEDDQFIPSDVDLWGSDAKRMSLISYANVVNDDKLLQRLYRIFDKEIRAFYSE